MATERDDEMAIYRAIGGRVDWYLRYAGDRRTQAELGKLLDLDQSSVSKKLRGERPFTLPELYRTAVWLDRQVSDFIPSADDLAAAPAPGPLSPPRARRRVSASARVRGAAINRHASDGDTHQYVSSEREFRFSRNVTDGQSYAQAA